MKGCPDLGRFILRAIVASVLAVGASVYLVSPACADVYAWWPLDDGVGDEARDLGPSAEPAIIFDADVGGLGPNGSVWVNDPQRGTVLGLAGDTAWASAGYLPIMDLENQFSWAFWARQDSLQTSPANDIILGNRYDDNGADTVPREFIKFTPDRFEYHMNGVGTNDLQYATNDIPSNDRWIHHAVVKQGDTLTYYRDGEFANDGQVAEVMLSANPLPFAMGGQNGLETWRGYLSDVQLYEAALTSAEIQAVMPGSVIDGKNLYARWKLDDGAASADTAKDSGPRGADGVILDWDFGGLAGDGSVWVDDPERGTVLGLAGDTAWVDAGEIPLMDFDNDFTWLFWAKQDVGQASPANDIIIGNRYDASGVDTVPREFIKFTPNQFEYHMNGASANNVQYSEGDDNIPSDEQWYHHVVVKDGDRLAYYRDGELMNDRVIQGEMLSPDPLPFAMGGQGGAETWRGYLSDVRLFDHALSDAEIAQIVGGGIEGDYDGDGELTAADLDLQAAAILSGNDPPEFDLNQDGRVNFDDRKAWVNDLKGTWIGDADFDGEFGSADFVAVFQAGKFELDVLASWSEGDWDGDERFSSNDFVVAFQEGGYELGVRPPGAIAAVPEPSSWLLILFGLLSCLRVLRVADIEVA